MEAYRWIPFLEITPKTDKHEFDKLVQTLYPHKISMSFNKWTRYTVEQRKFFVGVCKRALSVKHPSKHALETVLLLTDINQKVAAYKLFDQFCLEDWFPCVEEFPFFKNDHVNWYMQGRWNIAIGSSIPTRRWEVKIGFSMLNKMQDIRQLKYLYLPYANFVVRQPSVVEACSKKGQEPTLLNAMALGLCNWDVGNFREFCFFRVVPFTTLSLIAHYIQSNLVQKVEQLAKEHGPAILTIAHPEFLFQCDAQKVYYQVLTKWRRRHIIFLLD